MIPIFVMNYYWQENEIPADTLAKIEVISELDTFLSSSAEIKIAVINMTFDPNGYDDCLKVLRKLKDISWVIVRSIELGKPIFKILSEFDHRNFIFLINGYVDYTPRECAIYPDLFWLYDTARPYFLTDKFRKELISGPKQYAFEIMYGIRKRHREFVYACLNNASDQKMFLQSEFLDKHSTDVNVLENSIWWDDNIVRDERHPEFVSYYGIDQLRPSQIIPIKIYNLSAYSLICETWVDNNFSFFTEKLAKPMLAKRAFVVISGQNYLKNLRLLGFRTFDGIIDETYDTIDDDISRWDAAIKAARDVATKDQIIIQDKISEIVEHNANHLKQLLFRDGYRLVELKIHELIQHATK